MSSRSLPRIAANHLHWALGLSALVVACSAPPPDGDTNSGGGIPACGTDPEKQPAKCVDEHGALHCKASTGYPGDELALCEPDADESQLVHFGPSDYSDPEEMSHYLLPPGDEKEFCIRVNTTNTDTKYFESYHGRMRPNSHHFIVTMPQTHSDNEAAPWDCGPQVFDRWLFGAQTPQIDVDQLGGPNAKEGDPGYHLAHDMPPEQTLLLDLHYVNTTQSTILREAWATVDYIPESEVKTKVDLIGFYNPIISIAPNSRVTTPKVVCEVPTDASGQQSPVYLGLTTGHAHSRLQRLSLYHELPDGTSDLIYETRNWHEPGEANFFDGVTNPPLPVGGAGWGAASGYMKIMPGEKVSFECEYDNTENRTITFGDTTKDEMCNVFGFYFPTAGAMWNCF